MVFHLYFSGKTPSNTETSFPEFSPTRPTRRVVRREPCRDFVKNAVVVGGHIELIRFKEYYGMSRGQEHDQLKYCLSLYISREKRHQTQKPRSQHSLLPALPVGW